MILGYCPESSSPDLSSHLRLWFGDSQPNPDQLLFLRDRLRAACRSALVLGVPTLRQRKLHDRYELSYQCLEKLLRRSHNVNITDAAVHRFLHLSGDLLAFLRGSKFIGLVTSQPIVDIFARYFMPDELFVKSIPGEFCPASHYSFPKSMCWLDDRGYLKDFRIRPPYRGAPYLVGAGLMGKLICDQIRRSGGFAIDIGSVFDGWVEKNTRAYFSQYPSQAYRLEHAAPLACLDSKQRLTQFLELAAAYESCPDSFLLQ